MASFAPIRGTRAQIQATPIVDGQFLVETDQGVDNKIYMDEGSTRTIVGGNTVTGVLPELYIYSETGSVVTVEDAGGTSIPTSQVGTDHWICEVPDYGIYNIYSLLDGETTTQSINVDDCMIYTIDDSHFHCNVVVTYPSGVGASCQISGGGETYSAPALNPPDTSYKFVVHGKNTTYTITTNVDGVTKTATVTTGTTLDQTYNVSIPYARVNLTVETPPITGNVTCTDGTTTITRPVAANITLYLDLGTWTISGSDGVDTYDTEVIVSDLTATYEADLSSAPDGATVLPTDDIQIWLQCAKIKDKSYTTLEEVLDDNETLQKLISSENACNYMVRSKTWIQHVEIPLMTSDTTPSGVASCSKYAESYDAYKAFDRNTAQGWYVKTAAFLGEWLGYEFPTPVIINRASFQMSTQGTLTLDLKATNDNSDWANAVTLLSGVTASTTLSEQTFNNSNAYKYYRWYVTASTASTSSNGLDVQLYGPNGITEDAIAMRLIGEKNYASDTLLADSDWCNAICESPYWESIINTTVPVMTDYTTPYGEAFGTDNFDQYYPYCAFKGVPVTTSNYSSNTYLAKANTTGNYVGYQFTKDIKVIKIEFDCLTNNGSTQVLPITMQIGKNKSDYVTLGKENITVVRSSPNTSTFIYPNSQVGDTVRLYDADNTIWYDGSQFAFLVGNIHFYGRADVDETVYNVYSAADDTITVTPQGGGAAITITTNNDGYGTIAKSSLPNGTYTFASSKAENPNNLGASDYYSKQITVNNNSIIEILVMPEKALYWWGYINGAETLSNANGWTNEFGTNIFANPTYNINSIQASISTKNYSGIGSKNPIKSGSVVSVIYKATSLNSGSCFYLQFEDTKYIPGTNVNNLDNTVESVYHSSQLNGNKYASLAVALGGSSSTKAGLIYALWYE